MQRARRLSSGPFACPQNFLPVQPCLTPYCPRLGGEDGLPDRPHEIYRCPACQTALWSDSGGRPALRFVRVGTLDDPTALAPDVHIYTRSKLPWVRLPEGVPAFDAYYDMKALWPAPSLERRRAILA